MRLLLALCALPFLAQVVTAQPRHGGISAYDPGSFPGNDGDCGAIYVTTRALSAYPEPRTAGTPTRRVEAGRRIVPAGVSDVLVVLREPGRLVARRNLTVEDAQRAGSNGAETDVRISRGTRVDVLDYGGEGYVGFRVDGGEYTARSTMPVDASWVTAETRRDYTVESFPRIEAWVRLVPREGQPAAWLNASQAGVRPAVDAVAGCAPLAGQ